MNRVLTSCVALLAVVAVGGVPAQAATKKKAKPKSITKTFSMQLAPVPDPPQGNSCTRAELEGLSIHSEKVKTTGAGILSAKVKDFSGDWDITVFDGDNTVMDIGSGTTTGGGAPAQKGEDTVSVKVKKATTFTVRYCNFAGTPRATGSFTFTYS